MKTNIKVSAPAPKTAEGADAARVKVIDQLRRSVLACLLWEDNFYEDGETIAVRIATLVQKCDPAAVAALAIEARESMNLRHVPLLLLNELSFHPLLPPKLLSTTMGRVLRRADEPAEFLALYWKGGKHALSKQVKRGLAWSLRRFNEYDLAKYNRDGAVKLRDVLFLSHAKPRNAAQAAVWKKLVDGTLATPDTWETQLSAGKDKKATFERLIREGKLGYLALIRNLRNMRQAGCDPALVKAAIHARKGAERVLPFRFIAAAKAAPEFEEALDQALVAGLQQAPKLPGKTVVVIDVSGSMYCAALSAKSDMNRALAASALGAICRDLCEEAAIYATAGNDGTRVHATRKVPARHGMALADAIMGLSHPLGGGGIFLNQCMKFITEQEKSADRTIVITDEQDCAIGKEDSPLKAVPLGKGYMINVAAHQNGIGYKPRWTHMDGLSESVIRYIAELERTRGE